MAIWETPNRTWTYVFERERDLPDDQQTRWILGALDAQAEAAVADAGNQWGRAMLDTLRCGLRGVENLRDQDGSPVEMRTESVNLFGKRRQVPTLAWLSGLSMDDKSELSAAILEGNQVTEGEAKNS